MKPPETMYRGERTADGVRVTVDEHPLAPRELRCWVRCNGGFDWGYSGAGSGALARALVQDATGDTVLASLCYPWVRDATVATWGDRWQITAGEVLAWVEQWWREGARPGTEAVPERAHVPTVAEALSNPAGFVAGMDASEFPFVGSTPEGGAP